MLFEGHKCSETSRLKCLLKATSDQQKKERGGND
jgi:hypothetical protein